MLLMSHRLPRAFIITLLDTVYSIPRTVQWSRCTRYRHTVWFIPRNGKVLCKSNTENILLFCYYSVLKKDKKCTCRCRYMLFSIFQVKPRDEKQKHCNCGRWLKPIRIKTLYTLTYVILRSLAGGDKLQTKGHVRLNLVNSTVYTIFYPYVSCSFVL